MQRCPKKGLVVEIGSGAGFAKSFIPDIITSDILPYDGVDKVVDATKLPLENESVRLLCMLNVFHHIREVEKFLREEGIEYNLKSTNWIAPTAFMIKKGF